MNKTLEQKVQGTLQHIRELWPRFENSIPFIAFSTGKDSLAMTALIHEALPSVQIPCVYSHHDLEFPQNLEYVETMRDRGMDIQVVTPFLSYFELIERGIGFLTLIDPWCVPMFVGTAMLEWLKAHGATSPRRGLMCRGMSGSEYSHKYHREIEVYTRLDLPCFNPILHFTKEEILTLIRDRYGLPLNPIYRHMDRTYCVVCYTADQKRQAYSGRHYPEICQRYYRDIEEKLFDSGLINRGAVDEAHRTREEKIDRHGFVYWRRSRAQQVVGAVKRNLGNGGLAYAIRNPEWIKTKHLKPVAGHWCRQGNEIRFWGIPESAADTLIKRMLNCLDCGFCMVECFPARTFDRDSKALQVGPCTGCGKCLRLKFCMGWRHRFWRRVIWPHNGKASTEAM